MDQIKIGRFIAEKRKEHNTTQMQLAEKMGVTDRAVSKWETGKSMPDSSIMLELCGELGISVTDLLSGEVVTVDNYNEALENSLLDIIRLKEQADKRMLTLEVYIMIAATVILFVLIFLSAFIPMPTWLKVSLIVLGIILFLAGAFFSFRIEQLAGYYECKECGHRYVPSFAAACFAPHMGRTKYMKCPNCGRKSWQKKVLTKE